MCSACYPAGLPVSALGAFIAMGKRCFPSEAWEEAWEERRTFPLRWKAACSQCRRSRCGLGRTASTELAECRRSAPRPAPGEYQCPARKVVLFRRNVVITVQQSAALWAAKRQRVAPCWRKHIGAPARRGVGRRSGQRSQRSPGLSQKAEAHANLKEIFKVHMDKWLR